MEQRQALGLEKFSEKSCSSSTLTGWDDLQEPGEENSKKTQFPLLR